MSAVLLSEENNEVTIKGKRILVVDDNETNREVLKNQLERWDINVKLSGSGAGGA